MTAETFEGRVRDVADNIVRLAEGRPIQRVVWPRAECNTPHHRRFKVGIDAHHI